MKFARGKVRFGRYGRTPQGVRGLKCEQLSVRVKKLQSHPARGAWIEIDRRRDGQLRSGVAPRKGCVD